MSLDNKDLSLFCVYMHTNQINNKRYVGITNQKPSYRWRTDGSGYKHQMFGRAIDKYGWENFSHELLAIDVSKEEACKLEQKYIEKYKTMNPDFGYNISSGGESGAFGVYNRGVSKPVYQYDLDGNYIREWPSSDEIERQLGILSSNILACTTGKVKTSGGYQWSRQKYDRIGTIDSESTLRARHDKNIEIYKYNKKDGSFAEKFNSIWDAANSIENSKCSKVSLRKHILNCLNGNELSTHGYRWFREYQGDKIQSKVITLKCKKVYQYSLNGDYIKVFNSYMDAASSVGVHHSKISECCKGARKSSGGYMWFSEFQGDKVKPYSCPYRNQYTESYDDILKQNIS